VLIGGGRWSKARVIVVHEAYNRGAMPEKTDFRYLCASPEYDKAVAEAVDRRAKNAPKYRLTANAKRALGPVSPELAWLERCAIR